MPLEELVRRLDTDVEHVSLSSTFFVNLKQMLFHGTEIYEIYTEWRFGVLSFSL